MRKVLIPEIMILFGILFVSSCANQIQKPEIPDAIIEESNKFIISKVGEDFFNRYITLNYDQSSYYPPHEACIQTQNCRGLLQEHYRMFYSFKIPEKPYVDELIEFSVNVDGTIIPRDSGPNHRGLPNCIIEPRECDFPINETEAIHIAKNDGLEESRTGWEIAFYWYVAPCSGRACESYTQEGVYAWAVQTTRSRFFWVFDREADGRIIDANSGEILQRYKSHPDNPPGINFVPPEEKIRKFKT